ncbi:Uncharacterized protein FKW44_016036 [Caligus rogercresseyi]|uniref:Uncharacterized protein n=1 Tax=Caligus rogercresseyi TaxID=217165 RepID=A0A7T8H249_CALRO|nr:Uncharacterized protein FKW44_016036 [Caligus rogercresseyi]
MVQAMWRKQNHRALLVLTKDATLTLKCLRLLRTENAAKLQEDMTQISRVRVLLERGRGRPEAAMRCVL